MSHCLLREFPSTHWSQVFGAAEEEQDGPREVLAQLLKRYLPALRAHLVRGKRIAADEAEDLLQGFIADKILERNVLALADPRRGNKFRNFVLTVLDHYVCDQQRRRVRCATLAARDTSAASLRRPEDVYHRAWAVEVLNTAIRRMQQQCEASGRPQIWEVFERRVLAPLLEQLEPPPYHDLIREVGLRSRAEAYNALITAKRMFGRVLRSVVGEYASDEEVDAEIGDLKTILSRGA